MRHFPFSTSFLSQCCIVVIGIHSFPCIVQSLEKPLFLTHFVNKAQGFVDCIDAQFKAIDWGEFFTLILYSFTMLQWWIIVLWMIGDLGYCFGVLFFCWFGLNFFWVVDLDAWNLGWVDLRIVWSLIWTNSIVLFICIVIGDDLLS